MHYIKNYSDYNSLYLLLTGWKNIARFTDDFNFAAVQMLEDEGEATEGLLEVDGLLDIQVYAFPGEHRVILLLQDDQHITCFSIRLHTSTHIHTHMNHPPNIPSPYTLTFDIDLDLSSKIKKELDKHFSISRFSR